MLYKSRREGKAPMLIGCLSVGGKIHSGISC